MGAVASTSIVTDDLVYYADAGNRRSFPATGTTWTDLVNGNNGTLTNMDTGGFDSQKGGVIEFDGTNEHVEIGVYGASSVLNWGSGNGTIGVWMKSDDSVGTLIAMGAAGSGGKRYLIQYDNDGDKISFAMDNDVTLKAANGSDTDGLTDSKWHYVVGVRNGQYIYLYVDGVLDATTDLGAGYGSVDYTSNGGLYMGGIWHVGDTVGHIWNGSLALAHIYNRALSADEVSQNYEATRPRFEPRITKSGLVGNWDAGDPNSYWESDISDPDEATLKDTANGTEATFVNWDAGEVQFNSANGGYWEFDGTDQYIQCSTNSILQPQSFSVETWANDDQTDTSRPLLSWGNGNYGIWNSYAYQTKPLMYLDENEYRYWTATETNTAGWHHLMFTYTYDDITTAKLYVDGASISIYETGPAGSKASTSNCIIGKINAAYYTGSIALLRMYNRSLSVAEVMDNYNKTKGRFGH